MVDMDMADIDIVDMDMVDMDMVDMDMVSQRIVTQRNLSQLPLLDTVDNWTTVQWTRPLRVVFFYFESSSNKKSEYRVE